MNVPKEYVKLLELLNSEKEELILNKRSTGRAQDKLDLSMIE
jgi:hypothetical protein